MSAPAFPCPARSLSRPGRTPYHTSRDICYIFLETCRNIPASQYPLVRVGASSMPRGLLPYHPKAQHYHSTDEDCNSSLPKQLLAFSMHLQAEAMDVRGFPDGKKRLPVFRRLCEKAVEELKKVPDAQATLVRTDGWRVPLTYRRHTHNLQQGMN